MSTPGASVRSLVAGVWLASLLAPACESQRRGSPTEATADEEWDTIATPRRPAARYYLINAADRCYVYVEVADERATRREELCPRDLRDGERIRLSGHVCVREGGGPTRDLPVRCPKGLLFAEYYDRKDAGVAH